MPRELERSTPIVDIRNARVVASSMHRAVLRGISSSLDVDSPFADLVIRELALAFDPRTGQLARMQAEPHELTDALEAVRE